MMLPRFIKCSLLRPLAIARISARLLSRAETGKAALKPFYFAVHPDLFGQFPAQRATNEDSLKRLNSYIDNLENKFPVHPTHLTFFLKNGGSHEQRDVSGYQAPDDQFKTVRISLFSRDLYFTINQILRSCGMYDELKRNNSTKDTYTNADIPSPYGGPLDWLQVYRKFGDRTSNHERDFQNKTEVTLKSFLRDEMEKAKERLEQSEKSYEEAMSLSRQICTELGLVNLTLDCGWSCASCQGSLKNLLQLCKEKKADMLSLDRRPISSLSLSLDGKFIIPASTPTDLLLDFLLQNKEKSIALRNEYIRNVSKEREMTEKCKDALQLKSLTKDESVSVSQMLSCCETLIRHPFQELQGTRMIVSKYYRLSDDGHVTIPWDWE
ncbi:hypothetical protein QZH41_003176 [Actinostola sp. cb2023]|nr:hypothetical protein QZH41_003176 [Actinostola sp. cb2023]